MGREVPGWFNDNLVWVIVAAAVLANAIWLVRRNRRPRKSRQPVRRGGARAGTGPPQLTLEFSQPEFQDIPQGMKFVYLRNDGGLARDIQVGAISVGPYRAIFPPITALGGGESV